MNARVANDGIREMGKALFRNFSYLVRPDWDTAMLAIFVGVHSGACL